MTIHCRSCQQKKNKSRMIQRIINSWEEASYLYKEGHDLSEIIGGKGQTYAAIDGVLCWCRNGGNPAEKMSIHQWISRKGRRWRMLYSFVEWDQKSTRWFDAQDDTFETFFHKKTLMLCKQHHRKEKRKCWTRIFSMKRKERSMVMCVKQTCAQWLRRLASLLSNWRFLLDPALYCPTTPW